jgi:hypothetical protein
MKVKVTRRVVASPMGPPPPFPSIEAIAAMTDRQLMVEQIRQDQLTLRHRAYDDDCPGRQFYLDRITLTRAAIARLDRPRIRVRVRSGRPRGTSR